MIQAGWCAELKVSQRNREWSRMGTSVCSAVRPLVYSCSLQWSPSDLPTLSSWTWGHHL